VTARFDTIALEQVGPDRVRISGTRGEPPPATLKVAMNEVGGFRKDMGVALTGLDVEAKAQLVEEAFWEACPYGPDDYQSVTTRLVRTDKPDPASNEEATAVWRITLKDPDERKVGRAVVNAVTEIALATIPGFYGVSGSPSPGGPYGVYRRRRSRRRGPQHVVVLDGDVTVSTRSHPIGPAHRSSAPRVRRACRAARASPSHSGRSSAPVRATRAAMRTSGSSPERRGLAWLDDSLSVARLKELLPETAPLVVDRFAFPALRSLNFVIHGLLKKVSPPRPARTPRRRASASGPAAGWSSCQRRCSRGPRRDRDESARRDGARPSRWWTGSAP